MNNDVSWWIMRIHDARGSCQGWQKMWKIIVQSMGMTRSNYIDQNAYKTYHNAYKHMNTQIKKSFNPPPPPAHARRAVNRDPGLTMLLTFKFRSNTSTRYYCNVLLKLSANMLCEIVQCNYLFIFEGQFSHTAFYIRHWGRNSIAAVKWT